MTHRTDVPWDRDVVARWYGLAERRLAHLTELFETGRWRRYYSEVVFLENIREARVALETWYDLTRGKVSFEESKTDMLSPRAGETSSPARILSGQVFSTQNEPSAASQVPLTSGVSVAPETHIGSRAQNSFAEYSCAAAGPVELETAGASIDLAAIQERYPLLRNSLSLQKKNVPQREQT